MPWAALLVPLLLASDPVAAQERPTGRLSRTRTLNVSPWADGALPELYVARGTATLVSVDAPLGFEGPSLQDGPEHVRLVLLDGSSFIVLPSTNLAEGERLRLTVPLQSGERLRLALVTPGGEADTQVQLVPLQLAADVEAGVSSLARLINTSGGPVEMALPKKRFLKSGATRIRLESVLQMDQHLFVKLLFMGRPPSSAAWKALQLRAVMRNGAALDLPMQRASTSLSDSPAQDHTLVVVLPAGAEGLVLALKGEGVGEDILSVSMKSARPTP